MNNLKFIKSEDLMTEFVAAGLFFPVALMFQRVSEQIFTEGCEGGNLDLVTLGVGSLKLIFLLVASMSGVLLLGYAFHVSAIKRGYLLTHCIGATLLFMFFVTLAVTSNTMQLGLSGSLLCSYGISCFFDDEDIFEKFTEDHKLVGSAVLIMITISLYFTP